MQVKITPKFPVQEEAQEQTYLTYLLMRLASRIDLDFPWAGNLHMTGVTIQPPRIWLTWLGLFTEAHLCWLQNSPCVSRWEWRRGGSLSIPDQQVSIHAHAGFFGYETQDGQEISLAIYSSPLPTVFWSTNACRVVHSDEELRELLQVADVPLAGWTHRIRLCVRCDQPGAAILSQRCLACDMAYHEFMQPLVAILLQNHADEGPRQWQGLLAERQLALPDACVPDEDDLVAEDCTQDMVNDH